jgi:hypothetical protein
VTHTIWRSLIVFTLTLSLSSDLMLGNLALPRMTIRFLVSFALGLAAARLWVTWRSGRPR